MPAKEWECLLFLKNKMLCVLGLNAGVQLLWLSRMRKNTRWQHEILEIYRKFWKEMIFSDQDIINVYFARHTGKNTFKSIEVSQ